MKRFFARAFDFWALRSYLAGGVGTLAEISYVIPMVELVGVPRVVAVATGQVLGAAVAFVLNKYFAFRDKDSRVGLQASKYAAIFFAELAVHSSITAFLIHRRAFHYLVAKFVADLGVFVLIHIVVLRYVVFPRRPDASAPHADRRRHGDNDGLGGPP